MTEIINPLLARAKMPGEHFTLPSLGLFYNSGEISDDVENGEIYISPMVTLDEIILKNPDKLYSGTAVDEVFKRCAPQILKPLDLTAPDVDFVLTALRKISFGNTTEIEYHHDCKNAKLHRYNLDMSKFIKNTIKIDPTSIKREYEKTLENGQKIKLLPPTFKAALKIYQAAMETTNDESESDQEKEVLESIATMILQVDEITDKSMIIEWLSVLKPSAIIEIRNLVNNLTVWGTDFTSKILCKDCNEELDITSEINPISFFFE